MRTTSTWRIVGAVVLGMLAAGSPPGSIASAALTAAGAAQTCSNAAQFALDVTVPDNTIMRAGAAFTKTWRLRNTGTCTWTTSYKLMRDSGDALGGPVNVKPPKFTARNGIVDISVQLVAPFTPGSYTGYWQLADTGGRRFGPKIRVAIVVPDSAVGELLPDTLTFFIAPIAPWPMDFSQGPTLPTCDRGNGNYYAQGEELTVTADSYPPNTQAPMGIYRYDGSANLWSGWNAKLAHAVMAVADADGSLQIRYRIPAFLEPGRYFARLAGNETAPDTDFSIRAASDNPIPVVRAGSRRDDSGALMMRVVAENQGATASRGGSLTLSSPDVERLEILEADVPIVPLNSSNCNVTTPNARELTSATPCHRALQHNTACKKMVNLSYPMAEAWHQPWATGECHELTVRVWPLPGVREVRLYARAAMLAGSSGCRIEIAPQADETHGTDQQGFPVQVITVPVSQ